MGDLETLNVSVFVKSMRAEFSAHATTSGKGLDTSLPPSVGEGLPWASTAPVTIRPDGYCRLVTRSRKPQLPHLGGQYDWKKKLQDKSRANVLHIASYQSMNKMKAIGDEPVFMRINIDTLNSLCVYMNGITNEDGK